MKAYEIIEAITLVLQVLLFIRLNRRNIGFCEGLLCNCIFRKYSVNVLECKSLGKFEPRSISLLLQCDIIYVGPRSDLESEFSHL